MIDYNNLDTEIKSNSIYSISHQLEKEDHQSRIAAARPELGKINKITIRICKSVHFKVSHTLLIDSELIMKKKENKIN